MNAKQYIEFMERVFHEDKPCHHGHFGCSDVEGGKCSDEEYANLSQEQREIVDDEIL